MKQTLMAIMWKECSQIRARKRAILINSVSMYVFVIILAITRLLSLRANGNDSVNAISSINIYVSVTGTYMALLSLLRFWQEKGNRTIETLLCMPINVIGIVFAKLIVPVFVSSLIGFLNSVITMLIISVLYGQVFFSIFCLIIPIIFACLIGIPYSIINAYSMWCMNLNYSKLMQSISSFAYIGLLATLFINLNIEWFKIFKTLCFSALFLWMIALFVLFKFNIERIVLQLND